MFQDVELGLEEGSATVLCLSQEYDARKATFVKVVPTPNNGSTELVALHRDEVGTTSSGMGSDGVPRPGALATDSPPTGRRRAGGAVLRIPCPTLCDPMDCSPPGFSVHGILQARMLFNMLSWFVTACLAGSIVF